MGAQEDGDRRTALIDAVCGHLLVHGLAKSSLRDLAAAAQTSDRMLLYYFRDKSDLMSAALDRLCGILQERLEAVRAPGPLDEEPLRAALVDMVMDDGVWSFLQVWLEIVARGGRGDAICAEAGNRIVANFFDWIARQSAAPTEEGRREVAARLLPIMDGLIVLKAVGLHSDSASAWRGR
jgi:AcrR family transcriptional regulator